MTKIKQCKTCPWLKHTTTDDIHQYMLEMHQDHKAPGRWSSACVGWLFREINEGNNIRARMAVIREKMTLELSGEQVDSFEDTFK